MNEREWAEEYAAAILAAGEGTCACGWPEKPCLRRVLRNGPPFPAMPCEPTALPGPPAHHERGET